MSAAEKAQALANYAGLLKKVDDTFARIQVKAGAAMKCGSGCHQCCLPGLTVNALETAYLQHFIAAQPGLAARLEALAAADPHAGTRCQFLDERGRCAVYAARPIVCRSHGAPLEVREPSGNKQKSVCPLNFSEASIDDLPADLILNLDLLNTLLTLIDAQFRGASAKSPSPRTLLGVRHAR